MKRAIALMVILFLQILSVNTGLSQPSSNVYESKPSVMSTARNKSLRTELIEKCRSNVEYESRTACVLGVDLTLGAPDFASMAAYLALMNQCDQTYPVSGSGLVDININDNTIGKNRASCRTGIIWTRDALEALE